MAENTPNMTSPAKLSGTLIRKGGQIYQEPVTPTGAKTTGATPDQAKMAGTKAQKDVVVKEAVKPIVSTTITPQGLAAEETQQIAQERAQAEQLQQFGSYSDRVKQIAARKYAGAIGTPVGLKAADAEVLNTAFAEDAMVGDQPISAFLETYAANLQTDGLTPEQQEQPLVELSTRLQEEGVYVTPEQLSGWYQSVEESIGQEAEQRIADNVVMADFTDEDLKSLGFDDAQQVADLVGIQDLQDFQTLTLAEFQDAIEDRRQEIYNEINELQRQLALAPPGSQIAQQIQQRLTDLSGAGVATTERRMEELVGTLQTDINVSIGGQDYSIEDLLSDDNVSDFVASYLDPNLSEEDKANFFPEGYEGFKEWVDSNSEALTAVVEEQKKIAEGFGETQEAVGGFQSMYEVPVSDEILEKMGISVPELGTLTTEEWNQFRDQFESSNVGQIVSNREALGLDAGEQQDLLSRLTQNFDSVSQWDAATLVERYKMARDLEDPTSTLSQISNIGGDFINDNDVEQYNTLVAASSAIDAMPTVDRESVLNDPEIVEMIQAGTLTPDLISAIPANLAAFAEQGKIGADFNQMAQLGILDDNYKSVQSWATTGDPAAQEMLDAYKRLDADGDGTISEAEVGKAQGLISKVLSKQDFLTGQGGNLAGLVQMSDQIAPEPGGMYADIQQKLQDGITADEAVELIDTYGKEVEAVLAAQDADIPTNEEEVDEYQAQKEQQKAYDTISAGLDAINTPDGISVKLENGGSIQGLEEASLDELLKFFKMFREFGETTHLNKTDPELQTAYDDLRERIIGPALTEKYIDEIQGRLDEIMPTVISNISLQMAKTGDGKYVDLGEFGGLVPITGLDSRTAAAKKRDAYKRAALAALDQAETAVQSDLDMDPATWGFDWEREETDGFTIVPTAMTGASKEALIDKWLPDIPELAEPTEPTEPAITPEETQAIGQSTQTAYQNLKADPQLAALSKMFGRRS